MTGQTAINDGRIRFGIVGIGEVGRVHLHNLSNMEEVNIVGLCDPDDIKKEQIEGAGYTYYSSYKKLIDVVDAVVISSPTCTHAEIAIYAMAKKRHIFLEKPLEVNQKKAQELLSKADGYEKTIQMGFVLRFGEGREILKGMIEEGDFGRPICVQHTHAISAGAEAGWIHEQAKGGGMLMEGLVHHIDWGRYVFGELTGVKADLFKFKQEEEFDAPDTGCLVAEFEKGDKMMIHFSWNLSGTGWSPAYGVVEYKISGPKGCAVTDGETMKFYLGNGDAGEFPWPGGWGNSGAGYTKEMTHFLKAIQGEVEPKSSITDGYKSLLPILKCLDEFDGGSADASNRS